MTDETLVYFGGAVKAMGAGKIGGDVAPFGSPSDVDRDLEFFTPQTDFGLDVSTKARVVYHHGYDKRFGKRRLGVAELSLGPDAVKGTTHLDLSDPLNQWLYQQAEAGKLFWSSGSAPHLVERRAVKGAVQEITSWPIIECSLTTTPVNSKARAYPVKAILDDALKGALGEHVGGNMLSGALERLWYSLQERSRECMNSKNTSRSSKTEEFTTCLDDFRGKALALFDALLDSDEDATKAILSDGVVAARSLNGRAETLVADVEALTGLFRKAAEQRQADGRTLSTAKREALKAIVVAATELYDATAPKPETEQQPKGNEALQRLRRRLLLAEDR